MQKESTKQGLCYLTLVGTSVAWGSEAMAQAKKKKRKNEDLDLEESLEKAVEEGECTVVCCPPTTTQQIVVGVGTLVITVVLVAVFRWLVEKVFVKNLKSAQVGRNAGISLGLLCGCASFAILVYTLTGCWPMAFTLWAGFVLGK